MSGEYYCIEEVVNHKNYYSEYENGNRNDRNFAKTRESDAQSNASKQSQEFRLHEIEEQLEIAENRCNTLKGQLDSMKKIYSTSQNKGDQSTKLPDKSEASPALHSRSLNSNSSPIRGHKRRSSTPVQRQHKSKPCTPNRHQPRVLHESSDTGPQKSSSSSTGIRKNRPAQPFSLGHDAGRATFTTLIRQNSSSIGTDHSGAAVRTIKNILSGITDSVNRISKLPEAEVKTYKNASTSQNSKEVHINLQPNSAFELIEKPHLKHFESSFQEDGNNISEADEIVEEPGTPVCKITVNNIKAKPWSRYTNSKSPMITRSAKVQHSSGSINRARKSVSKPSGGGSMGKQVRESAADEESIVRRRKRQIKRLKPMSKVSVGRKLNNQMIHKRFEQFATDNLVELYHNIAAKPSDSDSNNGGSKSMMRSKGGGDLPLNHGQNYTTNENGRTCAAKPFVQQPITLPPINENGYCERDFGNTEYSIIKNYELPTIASKMKQVPKCYLRSFNFHSIPFCAAKSVTPSHNIGINIQQVMNIIKTRQPITGISPTLAHNISLAAGKLQNRPLSTLVSTLSSKIGYGRSQCPLINSPLDYNRLQEMAREIQDYDEPPGLVGIEEEGEENLRGFENEGSGDQEEYNKESIWTIDPDHQKRCTCSIQEGQSFQQVWHRHQMSAETVCPKPVKSRPLKSEIYCNRRWKGNVSTSFRKQRTRNWIKSEATKTDSHTKKPQNELKGKEKTLKMVLQTLHDDFERLNTKYEELVKEINNSNPEPNDETSRQLEEIENELNKKEEEINMVMSLYTEVLALKDQVKKLKEKSSQGSVSQIQNPSLCNYKEPKAALHLTQLLRQIQNYQVHCKNKN